MGVAGGHTEAGAVLAVQPPTNARSLQRFVNRLGLATAMKKNLRKVFPNGVVAVDNLSLTVPDGEFLVIIGLSGSGKSTLLRCINRLVEPTSGQIWLDDIEMTQLAPNQLRDARKRIGMIFQQFNLVGRLSLFTNVALGSLGRISFWRAALGFWPMETKLATMAALHRFGISDYATQRANTLSGGQQQRGAIARALVQKAKIILADEPVASLDPVSARRVMDILRELNRNDGLTVLVTLHQVDYALRYCDRVIALKAGKIAYDGPASGLKTEQLIEIYGPEFEDVFWEGTPA